MTRFTAALRTVYFIRPVGERGPIKIGCSDRPEIRCRQLQTHARKPLEIVAHVPGSIDDEHRVHSLFWHTHIGGEWFEWTGALQALMDIATSRPINFALLPETQVRRMPERRRPWTEDQKLRVRYARRISKAERKTGREFPHRLSQSQSSEAWKHLVPEIERFLEAAA